MFLVLEEENRMRDRHNQGPVEEVQYRRRNLPRDSRAQVHSITHNDLGGESGNEKVEGDVDDRFVSSKMFMMWTQRGMV